MEDKEMNPEGVSPETEAAQTPEATAPEMPAAEAPVEESQAEPPADEAAEIPGSEAGDAEAAAAAEGAISVEELMASNEGAAVEEPVAVSQEDSQLRAVLEAIIYVADEPLTLVQIAAALQQPADRIRDLLEQLIAEFDQPEHGVAIREVAGGYKMATKPEHHEAVRNFVKSLKPPLKLSLPALETLAVIAYKQPVTGPEIMEIRGVQGGGVVKTLLDRKLIAVAGRKNVIGKPILYKTTKEFLIQFGLKDLSELPSLKEFEEIRRMAFADSEPATEPADILPETDTGEQEQAPAAEAAEPLAGEAEAPAAAEPESVGEPEASTEGEAPAEGEAHVPQSEEV